MGRKNSDYVHFVPESPIDPSYPTNKTFILVNTLDDLKQYLSNPSPYMAWDTEATGLDHSDPDYFVVGYSFAFDTQTAYYVPVKHVTGGLGKAAVDLFYERLLKCRMTFIANMRYDFRALEYFPTENLVLDETRTVIVPGYDMSKVKYFDVLVSTFLADTNVPMPSLKWASRHFCGYVQKRFDETLGSEYNFFYLDPKDAYEYAAGDALSTFAVAQATLKYYKEAKLSGRLSMESLYPLMKFENIPLEIDTDWLDEIDAWELQRLADLEQEIYSTFGSVFKINSGKELSEMLQRIGVDTGGRVKAGYMKTGIEDLERAYQKNPHPVLKTLIEFKQLTKANGSYTSTLNKYAKEAPKHALRFCYHNTRVPTSRFACGSDGKNKFFSKINYQSIPKPKFVKWYVHECPDGNKVYPTDEVILGWRFSLEDKSDFVCDGASLTQNIRGAFIPGDESLWVSIDYSTQELKCVANYSNFHAWIEAFNNHEDLHKKMAIQIWGEDKFNHTLRYKAKAGNFGFIYLMKAYTFAHRYNMSEEEAQEVYDGFWKVAAPIKAWHARNFKIARKTGTIYNYFGLPRRVKHWMTSSDWQQRAFGERTVANAPVQSIGGDLIKRAIIKQYKYINEANLQYPGEMRWLSMVHDEVNLAIKKSERTVERILDMCKLMTTKVPGWPVTFDVGLEIGNRWGVSFPWKYDLETGIIKPDMEQVQEPKAPLQEQPQETHEDEQELEFDIEL